MRLKRKLRLHQSLPRAATLDGSDRLSAWLARVHRHVTLRCRTRCCRPRSRQPLCLRPSFLRRSGASVAVFGKSLCVTSFEFGSLGRATIHGDGALSRVAAVPVVAAPVAKPPGVVASAEAPAVRWHKLQCKLVALDGDWIKVSSFCDALRPKISSNQAKRDYILGATAWRIGPGSGNKLVHKTHWDNKAGSRGGGKPLVVKRSALEQVFYKYFAK